MTPYAALSTPSPSGDTRPVVAHPRLPSSSPRERLLLGATAALLPVEQAFPALGPFSITWMVFGLMAIEVLVNRTKSAKRVARHPVFLAGYLLLTVAVFMEALHGAFGYANILRLAEALAGAVLVGTLCRDRRALRAAMYGYLVAGVFLALFLFTGYYGTLSATTARSFVEVSTVRADTFAGNALGANPNLMGFYLAEGTVVALSLALTSPSRRRRTVFAGAAIFCFTGSFLSLSRAAAIIAVVSSLAVLMTRAQRLRSIVFAALLGAVLVIWAPAAVQTRLSYTTAESYGRPLDPRVSLVRATRNSLGDYILTGVGAGRYMESWAYEHGFASRSGDVIGTHNAFVQLTVFWGGAALAAFLLLLARARRCVPRSDGSDGLKLCLRGIAVALLVSMFTTHNLEGKQFALGLGLLVAADVWLWSRSRSGPRSPRPAITPR